MQRCEYTVTYEDFLNSMLAFRRISRPAMIGYLLYVWVIPITCVILAVVLLPSYFRSSTKNFDSTFWIVSGGIGVAAALPLRYYISLKRAFKRRDMLLNGAKMFCEFDEKTIRFVVPGGTEISYTWSVFTDVANGTRVCVLFVKDAAFHTIPKNAMDESGWTNFQRILALHPGIKSC